MQTLATRLRNAISFLNTVGVLLWWLLARPAAAQTPEALVQRRVQLAVAEQPLEQVLREMSRRSGVPFSYSSTFVPVRSRVTLRTAGAQPVAAVLTQLCQPRGLSWQVVQGQVVLWRTAAGPPPAVVAARKAVASRPPGRPAAANEAPASDPAPVPPQPVRPPGAARSSAPSNVLARRPAANPNSARNAPPVALRPAAPRSETVAQKISANAAPLPADLVGSGAAADGAVVRAQRRAVRESGEQWKPLKSRVVRVGSGLPFRRDTLLAAVPLAPVAARGRYTRTFQATFLPPAGSNGLRAGRTTNAYSLNALAGFNGGVERIEIGGLVNIVRDTVRGFQAAGLANVVGTEVRGCQAAVVANVLGGSVRGVQAAGVANITRDDARGLQVAGLLNIVGGASITTAPADSARPVRLRRWLGFPRLLATNPAAATPGAASAASLRGPLVQAAGLANLTGTDVRGLQTAPLLNVARRVSGVQLGLVNVAKRANGVQIGLVNVADSVNGAGLGLLNIVRHGYLRVETWTSETLPFNGVLKLGVERYYTLFGVATQPFGVQFRAATGFGIGTASKRPHGRFAYSLDVITWVVFEARQSSEEFPPATQLAQLRPGLAWQLQATKRLSLLLAPTLNYAYSYRSATLPDSELTRNQLLLWQRTTASSFHRVWPGLHVGVRF